MRVQFFADGLPQTKGSARAFVVGKRAVVTNDNPRAKGWARVVERAARAASPAPFAGPVAVRLVFVMPRPKAHSTKRGLRLDAPAWHSIRPDLDKLTRCALDALTGITFGDDGQVARLVAEKRYGARPGVAVEVRPAPPADPWGGSADEMWG